MATATGWATSGAWVTGSRTSPASASRVSGWCLSTPRRCAMTATTSATTTGFIRATAHSATSSISFVRRMSWAFASLSIWWSITRRTSTHGSNRREPMGPEEYGYLTDFRRFLSWRRGDAMTLGEANVAPKEVLNFFGNGDRMNLVFNFWANQHLFLAVASEDARPLRTAYEQLPKLPPTAQWANFLRNHDELDLGRLKPDERERCFAAFAPDPDMHLYGRGIRRRLSPMLQGDRRRLELMNSLMFTLPGTPVLRYGEEIGMGEELRLQ